MTNRHNYYLQSTFRQEDVKNPRTEVRGVFGFLNTSKIDFAFSRTKVGSLRKINFLSIKKKVSLTTFKEIWSISDVSPIRDTLAGYNNHPIDTVKSNICEIEYRSTGGLGKTIRIKVEVLE